MVNVCWNFFGFRNSKEKLCVSWALSLIECVAVWALKIPVVSAPLRSLHNRSPLDFLQLIPTHSKPTSLKVFLLYYWNSKSIDNKFLAQSGRLKRNIGPKQRFLLDLSYRVAFLPDYQPLLEKITGQMQLFREKFLLLVVFRHFFSKSMQLFSLFIKVKVAYFTYLH